MRTITFENQYSPEELAEKLCDAGFSRRMTLADIMDGKGEDVDDEITLECVVDEDDVVEALGDDAVLRAAKDIHDDGLLDREIEDAVRYTRRGDFSMAKTMFSRIFEGADLSAVQRALS